MVIRANIYPNHVNQQGVNQEWDAIEKKATIPVGVTLNGENKTGKKPRRRGKNPSLIEYRMNLIHLVAPCFIVSVTITPERTLKSPIVK